MSTTIYNQELVPELFGDPIKISLSIPNTAPIFNAKNKIPITIYLSKTGGNTMFGTLVYSVNNFKDPKSNKVFTTILQNHGDTELVEFSVRLSEIIAKKFSCPCYVNVNGRISLEESVGYIKQTVGLISDMFFK